MTNSVDPDQLTSSKPTLLELHYLQRQGISAFCASIWTDRPVQTVYNCIVVHPGNNVLSDQGLHCLRLIH